jgi:hypothetical protein
MNDDFDELDRAIFALPLEAPPPGLRASILASTVYAAPVSALAMRGWEIALVGALLALAVWLGLAVTGDPRFAAAATAATLSVTRALADTTTLLWLAAGAATAFWLSLVNFAPRPLAAPAVRS